MLPEFEFCCSEFQKYGLNLTHEMYEKYVLKKKNALRVKYAENVSFKTDVGIFFTTIWKVLEKAFGFVVKKEHR